MKIAVLGTGPVGQAIAGKLGEQGHEVWVGTRNPAATLARSESDTFGNPAFSVWHAAHPAVTLSTLSEAATDAELVVNATNGAGSIAALEAASENHLDGKVLLDVSNPLDFSQGMPPSLIVCNTDSLGEEIQRRFPRARVVKALSTMNASLMIEPSQLAGGDHTIFVSGNDAEAKTAVTGLLRTLGWRDVIDLGDITTARGSEMYFALWIRLLGALGTPMFNIKVVR